MRRVGLSLLGLLISAAAIFLVLRSVDVGATLETVLHARPELLGASLPLIAVGIGLRAWRWQRLLPADPARVPVRRIVPVLLIGYLGNSVLPARLGEPIRAYLLARREGLSSARVFGTAILERIIDLATLAIIAFAAALYLRAPSWAVQLTGVGALGGAVVVGLLTTAGLQPAIRLVRKVTGRHPSTRGDGLLTLLGRFAEGIGGGSQRGPTAQAALLSVPIWLTDGAICLLIARALGLDLAPAAALLVVGIGALGTSIPSAPGYVGTYELAVSSIARALGVSAESALALALLQHATTLLPVAVGGAVSAIALGSGSLSELARDAREGEDRQA